jgi:hypothetical protein
MSVGSITGVAASAAGAPLAQTTGTELERASHDALVHARRVDFDRQAQSAAGIAETDGNDLETGDRDADGRMPWQSHRGQIAASEQTISRPMDSDDDGQKCSASIDLTA